VNAFYADVYICTEPLRLHRRPDMSTPRPFFPFLPLGLVPGMHRRRRDAPPCFHLPVSFWATRALVLAIVVR
jgi:hypothetical protein